MNIFVSDKSRDPAFHDKKLFFSAPFMLVARRIAVIRRVLVIYHTRKIAEYGISIVEYVTIGIHVSCVVQITQRLYFVIANWQVNVFGTSVFLGGFV